MADGSLIIEIKGSAEEFLGALEEIKGKSNSLEHQLTLMAATSAAAFAGFTAEIYEATKAYGGQELATNRLSQALQAQGMYSEELIEDYKKQAEAIEKKTGVDAEQILTSQAMLQSMIGQIPITKELTQGVVDLAAAQHIDLSAAIEEVAKGINGHTKGLRNLGIEVDDTGDRQKRLSQIVAGLNQQFHGQAEAANEGLGGIKGLHAAIENVQKQIGEHFAPVLSSLIKGLTDLFNGLSENKPLLDFITSTVVAGVVVAGLATAVAGGALAWIKFKETMEAAKIAMSAMEIATKGLIGATGIGLLLIVLSEVYLHWSTVWPAMQGIYRAFADNIGSVMAGLGKIIIGYSTLQFGLLKEGVDQLKTAVSKGMGEYETITKTAHDKIEAETKKHEKSQDDIQKAAADKREADRRASEARLAAATAAKDQLLLLESNHASAATIELKRKEIAVLEKLADDHFKKARGALSKSLQDIHQLQARQNNIDSDQNKEFNDHILASDKRYQALSAADQKQFLALHETELKGRIETEETTRDKQVQDDLVREINSHNQLLSDQLQYGAAFASINQAMHTKEVEGFRSANSELVQMQNSKNASLKAIGKAAAVADITISTARSAMSIFQGFSTIPFIGAALGVAAAAAAIIYGAERIGEVTAAADGGIITGGIPGLDSVPVLAMPGELVVPTRNFDEVVSSVAAARSGAQQPMSAGPQSGGGGGEMTLQIQLVGDAGRLFESRILERQKLGTSQFKVKLG